MKADPDRSPKPCARHLPGERAVPWSGEVFAWGRGHKTRRYEKGRTSADRVKASCVTASFPAAAGVYLVISILQDTVSESIKNVLIAAACVTAFAAFMHSWVDRGAVQMLLFGGNIAFYGIILGWYLASMTSPVSKGR